MTVHLVAVFDDTRRRLRTAFAAIALVALVPLVALAQPARKDAPRTFDIPAGDAAATLKRFAAQSGEQLVYSSGEVEGVRTNEVRGTLDRQEALNRLLAGTPLSATQDDKTGALAIGLRESEKNAESRPLGERAADGALLKLEKYEVTGSRIRGLLGEATAQPLVTWTSEDFERSGFTTLGEFRNMIPSSGSPRAWRAPGSRAGRHRSRRRAA